MVQYVSCLVTGLGRSHNFTVSKLQSTGCMRLYTSLHVRTCPKRGCAQPDAHQKLWQTKLTFFSPSSTTIHKGHGFIKGRYLLDTQNNILQDDAWDQTTGIIWVPSGVLHLWPLTTFCLSLTASMLCVVVTRDGRKKNMSALAREQGVC